MSPRRGLRFTKMHGIGNDFVCVDLFEEKVPDPVALAISVSDRHFGIGSDGLILIGAPSEASAKEGRRADVSMRVFNADGSEAQMCGNGIRCVAKYAYEHREGRASAPELAKSETVRVETASGVKSVRVRVENGRVTRARVDMGEPRLLRKDIPMTGPANEPCVDAVLQVERALRPNSGQADFLATCVSMGNPHCVIFVPDVQAIALEQIGPAIERHEAFPERTNVHFAQVVRPDEIIMRTWERGSGITLACGSGASAVCVAGALTGRTGRKLLAHLPGGDLDLEFPAADNHVFMTGPATEVFTGEWPIAR